MISTIRLLVISLSLLSFNSYASDLAKEKRWADQVVDAILDGDAVWLNDGKSDFLGIYTEAEEDKGRAVIVMHGTGIHPDWAQVVQPLRVGLIEHNWNTLSIQMPVLPNEAEYKDYAPLYDEVAPRIDAAIKYLQENGSKDIVLIGHSQGSAMTAYYLTTSKQDVKGFVAIGMATLASDPRMNSIKALESIKVPVFDLYGSEDLEEIIASAGERKAAAKKAGNKNYKQTQITGNHFFDGQEDELLETVADWLDKTAAP
ncbi:MAG: alpha/beta hydrolase family protein [Gammaproteobacteria bacterium]|nr:alpha/beta hydrolase family protein [Gammaproteobacteria bacterium]NNJ50458.1 alpha/beta fold hydrolase [Gammaproteobacteria bacterium]